MPSQIDDDEGRFHRRAFDHVDDRGLGYIGDDGDIVRAPLGLHPEKIGHLVALLEWLEIIHDGKDAGNARPNPVLP